MILFNEKILEQMSKDALINFPHECCGFFFGSEDVDVRLITYLMQANNISKEDKHRRFSISPEDYIRAENYAWENKLTLLGIYHSHPDHPAIPSELDRLAAQPFFSYVIISVTRNIILGLRSWRLNDQNQFEEEIINHLKTSSKK